MIRSRGLIALAAVAALSLTACTNNDADGGDVADAMTDAGLAEGTDPNFPECMGEEFERAFDQDQMNDLAAADNPEDFPSGTEETVNSIVEECAGESVPGAEGSESEGEDTESEPTTTTAAEGN
jgi:predicted small secreted protein